MGVGPLAPPGVVSGVMSHPTDFLPAPVTGCAVGDALGVYFETMPSLDPRLIAWDGRTYLASPSHHVTEPGQYSDDTQMTVALGESLFPHGYNHNRAMDAYLEWFQSGKARGMGGSIRKAMLSYMRTKNPLGNAVPGAKGTGTAMRIAPIGMAYRHDLGKVMLMASLDAGLTHQSPEAKDGAVAVALGVACLATRTLTPSKLPRAIAEMLPVGAMRETLETFPTFVKPEQLKDLLRSVGHLHIVQAVAASFACLAGTGSFHATVEAAIRNGGDTDTIAAMAGALAGTWYGYNGIPHYFLTPLEEKNRLLALDRALYAAPGTNPNFPALKGKGLRRKGGHDLQGRARVRRPHQQLHLPVPPGGESRAGYHGQG